MLILPQNFNRLNIKGRHSEVYSCRKKVNEEPSESSPPGRETSKKLPIPAPTVNDKPATTSTVDGNQSDVIY